MARPGKSIAKQSEGRAGEKYLPVGGRVRKLRAVGAQTGRPLVKSRSTLESMKMEEEGLHGRFLSLAECARSECAPSLRAVRDHPGHPAGNRRCVEGEMGRESSQESFLLAERAR
jgi:hypothetical protein